MRQHIQQYFRITVGIDVTAIFSKEVSLERLSVCQIAVMRERDPIR